MDILLITPPFTQLNTPYPATAYLKGFLNEKGYSSYQMDLGIEVVLKIFCKEGLYKVFQDVEIDRYSKNAQRIFANRSQYISLIDDVVGFLQGKKNSLAYLLANEDYLPRASKFGQLDYLEFAFGSMGILDKAKHLSTLFIEDLGDFISECIDPDFGFSRYAEKISRCANEFDELYVKLGMDLSYIDQVSIEILNTKIKQLQPKCVGLSVPFPGNLFSALRCGQFLKSNHPEIKVIMGGGFPNTELRSLKDSRVFEFVDYITLDDGEAPLDEILKQLYTEPDKAFFKRTFYAGNEEVIYQNNSLKQDYRQANIGTPDYSNLKLDEYIQIIDIANPMHRFWTDGRWNKLTMAHGCYWKKCTFCDVSLDYISRYEPIKAQLLVDRMEIIIEQTGEVGFHFVDEAAPPALMRDLALEIIGRNLTVVWWTNIRFEKRFTRDLCLLLKKSGCVAVSGGLEVASDRLLKVINKGVSVGQVAKVTSNFTEAGILVHSYLMYGYPTQTIQETIDSLEMVRQLFECGIVQSGFWHQFALTTHSPIALDPSSYGVSPSRPKVLFADNDLEFTDETGIDHSQFSEGLKASLYNYMHGLCFDLDLQDWFDFEVPQTSIDRDFILNVLEQQEDTIDPKKKMVWIGNMPTVSIELVDNEEFYKMVFYSNDDEFEWYAFEELYQWLMAKIEHFTSYHDMTLSQLKDEYDQTFGEDPDFLENIINLCSFGLVLV